MASKGRGCLSILLVVTLVAALLALGAVLLARGPHGFTERVEVPLPLEIGGTLALTAEGSLTLELLDLAAETDMRLELSSEDLNSALPIDSYSILVQETESERISSMLGRLEFVPGSAEATIDGDDLAVSADLTGILFVRESREYRADEEQPGAGDQLELGARALFTARNLSISPQWSIGEAELIADIRLDDETRAAWHGHIEEGDGLAELVESILNQRAGSYVSQIDTATTDMRVPLTELMARIGERIKQEAPDLGYNPVSLVRFNEIEIDNCPSQSGSGAIGIGFRIAAELVTDGAEEELPDLPDLAVRDGPC